MTTFDRSLIGRTATTQHGERVTIVGPALDPARCTVRPLGGDPAVVETFTPRVASLTLDTCGCPDDCGCRQPWRTNYCGCHAHAAA